MNKRTPQLPALLDEPVSVQLIVGAQWGDEGKGKIVDLFCERSDIVARYQGGPNAGHTVRFGNEKFILHQIPSGILRPHPVCVMGNGVVINPDSLLDEIAQIESKGIEVYNRLLISPCAHLILPYHQLLDRAIEDETSGEKIGTTGRGIGPAYADKANRSGIRIGMLLDSTGWEQKVRKTVRAKNLVLQKLYDSAGVEEDGVIASLKTFLGKIRGCVADVSLKLREAHAAGQRILLEGAQGTLLDIDFGTYPFVTSSNTTIGGAYTGLGLHPRLIDRVIGVVKAYTTRVGNGPFPTELTDALGERIRTIGSEFGATTGRPRRCGWFDAVVAKYAIDLNGIDALAIMKLDVLDSINEIKICTGYRYDGKTHSHFPPFCHVLDHLEPVYITLPGWKQKTSDVRRYGDLPKNARTYIEKIETLLGVPVRILSVGAEREVTIWK
jgi:adenylosuccinate synthase